MTTCYPNIFYTSIWILPTRSRKTITSSITFSTSKLSMRNTINFKLSIFTCGLICSSSFIKKFSINKFANSYNKSDTAINHVRIDSIQLVITERESIVYKLKEHEKDIEDKVISLNDSATWELFKKLVSE